MDLNAPILLSGNLLKVLQSIVMSKCIPSGVILSFAGSTIPDGWALCNGQNGTPDLRDKFIVTSGTMYPYGTSFAGSSKAIDDALIVSGSTTSVSNGISYYSLYSIMKL